MFLLYSLLYSLAFVLMLPLFILRREKYAAGFWQRLGHLPEFKQDDRPVLWLHCVSVGETNAARPLVGELKARFPAYRLVVSTTTKTGQELTRKIFADKADRVFYFPFDWKFSVRRALRAFQPSVVLLMETEIWPRFFREAHLSGASLAIVNGRLSEKSFKNYSYIKPFLKEVLCYVDLVLMQGDRDAARIISLGIAADKVSITGNLKFDQLLELAEDTLTAGFRERFDLSPDRPLIIAASTHATEEKCLLESFVELRKTTEGRSARLMIAPRHPGRFDEVWHLVKNSGFSAVRRSEAVSPHDKNADIILLDSIGELRAAYPLADIVFVGGSLIPHGAKAFWNRPRQEKHRHGTVYA
jgi:3-deoxy-D-manno-octulosonic-acid transferase